MAVFLNRFRYPPYEFASLLARNQIIGWLEGLGVERTGIKTSSRRPPTDTFKNI